MRETLKRGIFSQVSEKVFQLIVCFFTEIRIDIVAIQYTAGTDHEINRQPFRLTTPTLLLSLPRGQSRSTSFFVYTAVAKRIPQKHKGNKVSTLRTIFIATALLGLSACKIIATSPDEGSIVTATGNNDCGSGETCEFDVENGSEFSETYTAVANPGYLFQAWREDPNYLCGGGTDPCALNDVPGSFTDQDITLFIEPVFVEDPDFLGSGEAFAFFESNVADAVIQNRCVACHFAGGAATATPLLYRTSNRANYVSFNYDVIANYVLGGQGSASLMLSKSTGGSGHGGGAPLTQGSDLYIALETFLNLLED